MSSPDPTVRHGAVTGRRMRKRVRSDHFNLTASRLDSLRRVFPSDAAIAEALQISRASLGRWRRGAIPDAAAESRLIGLDAAVSLLATYLQPTTVAKWLTGPDPYLGDRAPIELIRRGQLAEVIGAVEADRAGVFA